MKYGLLILFCGLMGCSKSDATQVGQHVPGYQLPPNKACVYAPAPEGVIMVQCTYNQEVCYFAGIRGTAQLAISCVQR